MAEGVHNLRDRMNAGVQADENGPARPACPRRALRTGFSTGTAAAAAAQGALRELLGLPEYSFA